MRKKSINLMSTNLPQQPPLTKGAEIAALTVLCLMKSVPRGQGDYLPFLLHMPARFSNT